ncbi:putative GPI-anchored wall transfer protein GWT1 [Cardiosporidium cionae]|uniref:GPI-anchored wall transfer protein GWT1 n=1 Tax=Cardiosporidium cionae TaxID=476202 RepID=A0ABQ7JBZ8_9APIC|nr:putative GPI-anchored wall transfer protein GWT1 [Cardiosporidium cionae]|eukprot:KAF8821537.1 putative GPI-anchored wall transfer protein GWT1 [Cardiosporidium cionae]
MEMLVFFDLPQWFAFCPLSTSGISWRNPFTNRHFSSDIKDALTHLLQKSSDGDGQVNSYNSCITTATSALYENLAAVSYHNPSVPSISSVILTLTLMNVAMLFGDIFAASLPRYFPKTRVGYVYRFLYEFSLCIFMLGCVGSPLFFPIVVAIMTFLCARKKISTFPSYDRSNSNNLTFISNVRSLTSACTFVSSVLISYFFQENGTKHIQPMDMGVVAIIFTSALVHKSCKGIHRKFNFWRSFTYTKYSLLLGIIRCIANSISNYKVPVVEYGKHWNFFFTITLVFLALDIILGLTKSAMLAAFLGIASSIGSEIIRYTWKLDEILLNLPRTGFFSSNKEGLLGSMELISFALVFVGIGRLIHVLLDGLQRISSVPKRNTMGFLFSLSIFGSGLLFIYSAKLYEIWTGIAVCRALEKDIPTY